MENYSTQYIASLIQEQLNAVTLLGNNDDVYLKRPSIDPGTPPFDMVPCCIYIYHITLNTGHLPVVNHYFYPNGDPENLPVNSPPISWNNVAAALSKVGQAINNGTGSKYQKPMSPGYSFQDMIWNRISYIAFIFDDPSWKFVKRPSPTPVQLSDYAAVVFNVAKKSTPNHSFYGGRDIDIDVSPRGDGTQIRTAFHMTNYLVEAGGNPLQTKEPYVFDMNLSVPYSLGGETLTVVFDPSGTNNVPPLAPPP
jgi:hypothetical protein